MVTKRYVERTVRAARDEIIRAILFATAPGDDASRLLVEHDPRCRRCDALAQARRGPS